MQHPQLASSYIDGACAHLGFFYSCVLCRYSWGSFLPRHCETPRQQEFDPELFERCAADLLRDVFPMRVPIRGTQMTPVTPLSLAVCPGYYRPHSLRDPAIAALGCSAATIAQGEALSGVTGAVTQLERGDPLLRAAVPRATRLP
jgi:hypothetical protein